MSVRALLVLLLLVLGSACSGGSSTPPPDDTGEGGPDGSVVGGGSPDGGPSPGGTSSALFTQPMPWTRDVSAVAKAAQSDTIINALQAAGGWGTGDFRTDFSPVVLRADASTPHRSFTPKDDAWAQAELGDPDLAEFYRPDCDEVQVPLPSGGALEGESGYACTSDGDCHLLVVDPAAHRLYEMWRADLSGGRLLGGCTAVWDLSRAYGDTLRGKGCSSADGAGFPLTAMLATADEVAAGEVRHALRFILPNERIRRGIYVAPATHSTFATSGGASLPPYGVRLRLKASYEEAQLPSEGARVLARALKRYGMFLSDGGNLPLTLASDRFAQHTWASLNVNNRSLSALKVTDFEVVEPGTPVDWRADTTCYRNP
ncbi:hypothetical protein FGE12_08000 [Aggregicoccus sp. 17bor-14]|uniref:hypothetical protein n=1 Tax=Myxococcaceae TaxID=31 RepID=UPI00129C27CC|nr:MULTISPECIES: hypothetical protein [Myxococcaceae]MBF5042339.1 hypothetical protein [Simulacricoccus sp. 17bor-14]MRI88112.1 hypothetical protein [Aggregicoccus sp. 17bor-14]